MSSVMEKGVCYEEESVNRYASSPEQALLEFFQSTYEAGATKEKNSGQKTI